MTIYVIHRDGTHLWDKGNKAQTYTKPGPARARITTEVNSGAELRAKKAGVQKTDPGYKQFVAQAAVAERTRYELYEYGPVRMVRK